MQKKENTELKRVITTLKRRVIPYQTMTSWNRNRCEGYNEGIEAAIKIVEAKIKRNQQRDRVDPLEGY